ncbi:TVP38/TMEM64 family protein [Antrihabitans sp. YC2-6]|uniref:TVP38/TMEM64 family protein n=1 Tax=Antrihabitans sp. YC2-6 TaxID=2799498 RepID=UPI0018F5D4E8|nr:TVP38/TMEM64 family protein [Antrihabitans sp. YC2-6]MBJ8347568.1 TVP38/TMEM64 family protein [Antrihabitans sp. YC2-6]
MTNAEETPAPAPSNRRHLVRLALFGLFLTALFVIGATTDLVDVDGLRRTVEAAGPLAPVAFVVVSAVLAAVFVPGPILAATSGLLFGPVLGTVVTLSSTVGTALIANRLGRRGGLESARALIGPRRMSWLDYQLERRGLWAVAGQRLIPGISDAAASYAFGAIGVPLWQMALGALIGSAPRAFVYTALGSVVDDPASPLGVAALVIWCVTAIAGVEGVRRAVKSWRAHSKAAAEDD